MIKFAITKILADFIKTSRFAHKLSLKDLAAKIDKDSSFLSKVENAHKKSIDDQVLQRLLLAIYDKNSTFTDFLNSDFPRIVEKLIKRHGYEAIKYEMWLKNYDEVYRSICVPENFHKELHQLMRSVNIEETALLKSINDNFDAKPYILNKRNPVNNVWEIYNGNMQKEPYIIMKLPNDIFAQINSSSLTGLPYYILKAIVFHCLRSKIADTEDYLSQEDLCSLLLESDAFLNKNGLFSLVQHYTIADKETKKEVTSNEVTSNVNDTVINDIAEALSSLDSNHDVQLQLLQLAQNLKTDPYFFLKLCSLDYSTVHDMSFSVKKDFLQKIQELLKQYEEMPIEKKKYENY